MASMIIILILFAVIGGIGFYVVETRFHKPKDNKPKFVHPAPTKKKTTPYQRETAKPSTAQLSMSKKLDNEITTGTVTLVADITFSRDEGYGWVDIYEGHHADPPAHHETSGKIQSWKFLGSGDRYNSQQRSADFQHLREKFDENVESILAQFIADGWTAEPISTENRKHIHLLSR